MESATWCRTPAAASAARRLRPEVSKNSSTALFSNEGELARSIATCAPARAPLSPSPVIVLMPLWGDAATTSWPRWRRMATVFEPIRPVPPMMTIFIIYPPFRRLENLRANAACSVRGGHFARGGNAGSSVWDAKACRTMRARAECFEISIGSSDGQPRVTGGTSTSVDEKRLVGTQFQHRTFDFGRDRLCRLPVAGMRRWSVL